MKIKLQFLRIRLRKLLCGMLAFLSLVSITSAQGKLTSADRHAFKQPTNKSGGLDNVRLVESEKPDVKAMEVTVTGTVLDQNGNPIPGVTVSIPGTGIGTATDMDGKYSLTVPEEST